MRNERSQHDSRGWFISLGYISGLTVFAQRSMGITSICLHLHDSVARVPYILLCPLHLKYILYQHGDCSLIQFLNPSLLFEGAGGWWLNSNRNLKVFGLVI